MKKRTQFYAILISFALSSHAQAQSTLPAQLEVEAANGRTAIEIKDKTANRGGAITFQNDAIDSKKYELSTYIGNLESNSFLDVKMNEDYLMTVSGDGKVGINTSTPSEALDVNGNMNLDGQMLINHVAAAPGQVLGMNSSGNTGWVSMVGSNNYRYFQSLLSSTGNFSVPAGVTEICVEIWAGGGGGGPTSGAGSGAYAKVIFDVVPGEVFSYAVGQGGRGFKSSVNAAADGGDSSFSAVNTTPNRSITVQGGKIGSLNSAGRGGSIGVPINTKSYIFLAGNTGTTIQELNGFNVYGGDHLVWTGGDGGDGPLFAQSGGQGMLKHIPGAGADYSSNVAMPTQYTGAGGGGGFGVGSPGANGRILVRW